MLRSGTVNTNRELAVQGKPVRSIAWEWGVARNTVRKYVRGTPEAQPRPRRGSRLDPYKEQIQRWVREDHLLNCATMYRRLQTQGYTGHISILKDFVRPLRPPAAAARRPVIRYETHPGEQRQFDWGECVYEQAGQTRKVFGFTAGLRFLRLRVLDFVKGGGGAAPKRCLLAGLWGGWGGPRRGLSGPAVNAWVV